MRFLCHLNALALVQHILNPAITSSISNQAFRRDIMEKRPGLVWDKTESMYSWRPIFLISSSVCGRGPNQRKSPLIMEKNCGSSSILKIFRNLPIFVIRRCDGFSSSVIVLIFQILITLPLYPKRSCPKKRGPLESSFTKGITKIIAITAAGRNTKATILPKISAFPTKPFILTGEAAPSSLAKGI